MYLAAIDEATGAVLGVQDILPREEGTGCSAGEISTFVALRQHRQGIGRELTTRSLATVRMLGYRTIHATVRADNPHALQFYIAQGFRIDPAQNSPDGVVVAEFLIA